MFIVHALSVAFAMFWEILWALILGGSRCPESSRPRFG
jgi:hypothetical protein